jgi:Flp pilus assembly protein TadG
MLDREEGAAAVEFALVAGLLVILLFGILQFGMAFWQMQSLRASVREGARVAAVGGTPAQIDAAVVKASSGALPTGFTGVTLSPAGGCPNPATSIDQSVTVSLDPTKLPKGVTDVLTINIPLLPQIPLHPQISGTFRCEN